MHAEIEEKQIVDLFVARGSIFTLCKQNSLILVTYI